MRTKLFLASALFLVVTSALGQSPESFDGAKKLLAGIHEEFGHLETVYCGCPYVRKSRSGGEPSDSVRGETARPTLYMADRTVRTCAWSARSCSYSTRLIRPETLGKRTRVTARDSDWFSQ